MKPDDLIYGLLIHLGRNMWAPHKAADHVRCDEAVWREITEHMADVGANMLVIDLGSVQTVSALEYLPRAEQGAPESVKDFKIYLY